MKVCAVTTWPPHRDGVALYSAQLFKQIAKLVDVSIAANIPRRQRLSESYEEGAGEVLRCWKRGLLYPMRIFGSASKTKAHIVHLQHGWLLYGGFISSILFPFLLWFLRLNRKPCVVTMHTVIERNAQIYSNPLVNFLARTAALLVSKLIVRVSNRVIVHNPLMRTTLQTGYALQEEEHKIVVIPHGVSRASENPRISEEGKGPLVLLLGFVREGKGIEHVVKAFERFSECSPQAKLLIVGDFHPHDRAGYIESLRRLFSSNVPRNIFFTGFLDEKKLDGLIWMSDILVLPSTEGCFIETSGALARVADYGKPIVCSRVPKFEGELQDREECIMAAPGDSEEMAHAFVSILQNTQFAKHLGEKLKERFRNRSWSFVARQHFELYKSVLQKL
jgi:glycosyltransferase involved in cell wall biosynthesis